MQEKMITAEEAGKITYESMKLTSRDRKNLSSLMILIQDAAENGRNEVNANSGVVTVAVRRELEKLGYTVKCKFGWGVVIQWRIHNAVFEVE